MFNNLFSFGGRIRRREYVLSLFFGIVAFVLIYFWTEGPSRGGDSSLIEMYYIPVFWFLFTQGSKRCHDIGNTGWVQLIPFFIPWMIFKDGEPGTNFYGENPKGIKKQYSSGNPDILDDGYEGNNSI